MSKKIKRYQDRKAAVVKLMREMSDKLETEERQFNEEEKASYDKLETELSGLNEDIKREERLAEIEKSLAVVPDRNRDTEDQSREKNGQESLSNKYPATYSRFGKLKAFTAEKSTEENLKAAYRAGMWLQAVIDKDGSLGVGHKARQWCLSNGLGFEYLASQTGTTNAGGGALVPIELSDAIITLRETYGVFRQNVRVMPMSTDTLLIPRRTSGLTAYFVADTDATTESTKAYDNVQLSAKELAALCRYPNSLSEDAVISLADDLTQEIAWKFAQVEDQCGFIGDGTSTYGGIVGAAVKINDGTHAAGISTSASTHTGFGTLDIADFTACVGLCPQYALPNAKWYISQAGFAASMQKLMYAAGGNTTMTIPGGTAIQFLGYPVVITQVLNSTLGADASKIKCLFGDLGMAAKMGNRREITIQVSTDRYFEYGQVGIRGSERFDINVHDLGDGSTPGPLVALKTAGS